MHAVANEEGLLKINPFITFMEAFWMSCRLQYLTVTGREQGCNNRLE